MEHVIAIDDSDSDVEILDGAPPPKPQPKPADVRPPSAAALRAARLAALGGGRPAPAVSPPAAPSRRPAPKRPAPALPAPAAKRPAPADRGLAADDEIEILTEAPPVAAGKKTFACVICMDDVPRRRARKLRACGHQFCVDCVRGTINAAIDDKKLDERLRCPDPSCKLPLDVLDVRASTIDFGDAATWEKYQEVATLASLDIAASSGGGGTRRCPGEKCNYTFQYEPDATRGTLFICPQCNEGFCLGCPVVGGKVGPAHDNHCDYVLREIEKNKELKRKCPCKYDKWSIENAQADEKFKELMRKEGAGGQTKPCPRCKQAVTKNGGCDHMTCPCGHHFSWSTSQPYGNGVLGGFNAALGGMFGPLG